MAGVLCNRSLPLHHEKVRLELARLRNQKLVRKQPINYLESRWSDRRDWTGYDDVESFDWSVHLKAIWANLASESRPLAGHGTRFARGHLGRPGHCERESPIDLRVAMPEKLTAHFFLISPTNKGPSGNEPIP